LDYYANFGPVRGPARYRDTPPAVGVLEAIDKPMPIGTAVEAGWTEDGVALWRLTVQGVVVPGRWSIVDRRFIPQFKSATDPDGG
jgi:hypothetical protein